MIDTHEDDGYIEINAFSPMDKQGDRVEGIYLGANPHQYVNAKTAEVQDSFIHSILTDDGVVRFAHKVGLISLLGMREGAKVRITNIGEQKNAYGGVTRLFQVSVKRSEWRVTLGADKNEQVETAPAQAAIAAPPKADDPFTGE